MRRTAQHAPILLLLAAACGASPASDAGPLPDAGRDAGPAPPARAAARPLSQWVDPFIGTGGTGFNDIGNAFPGPQRPFGMARPGPDGSDAMGRAAPFTHCSGYHDFDTHVRAFSMWRLHGIGINDGGGGALMPVPDFAAPRLTEDGYRAAMRPGTERASPGFYEVELDPPAGGSGTTRVEITATERVGLYRFAFEGAAAPGLVVPLAHAHPTVTVREGSIEAVSDDELALSVLLDGGYSGRYGGQRLFFVIRSSVSFAALATFVGGEESDERAASGADAGAAVRFAPGTTEVVVAIGMSYVDLEHARASLAAEAGDLDFDRVRSETETIWEDWLGIAEIDARTDRDFRRFYTALYHASLMPSLATERDGVYRGIDGELHNAEDFTYYTDLSLWDTYRTLHPWIHLTRPEIGRDFVRSLMAMAEDRGLYPRWPMGTGETGGMLGEPAAIVIADAALRGVTGFDVAQALDLFDPTALGDPPGGRGGMEPYLRLGWVTTENGGSAAARTMEFAWADDALANLAALAGRPDEEADFRARGRNYQNLWDGRFFVGRSETGAFGVLEDPNEWNEAFYAEGNAWQYLWLAPHDPEGLAETLGGRTGALARLTEFFTASERERRAAAPPDWYWQANEPDIHAPFLYAQWGDREGVARWSSWAREVHYDDDPTGIPGNDDSGTMSAWYLFAALGLYPVAGSETWALGSPSLNRATIHRAAGDLVVEAPDAAFGAPLDGSIALDGAPLEALTVPHDRIAAGGTLRFSP